MTIEGAIVDLQKLIGCEGIPFWAKPSLRKIMETVEMEREQHIEALKERRTGKWNLKETHNSYEVYTCDKCKRGITVFHRYGCSPTTAQVTADYPYCHCGAKMEVDK